MDLPIFVEYDVGVQPTDWTIRYLQEAELNWIVISYAGAEEFTHSDQVLLYDTEDKVGSLPPTI